MIKINVDKNGLRVSLLELASVKDGSLQDLADREEAERKNISVEHERLYRAKREVKKRKAAIKPFKSFLEMLSSRGKG